MIRAVPLALFCAVAASVPAAQAVRDNVPPGMARVPAGIALLPFLGDSGAVRVRVEAFFLDTRAVTTAEFLDFVRRNPRYRKARIARLFADEGYLRTWKDDLQPTALSLNAPVTAVSWHAAKAYCADRGKRLPSTAEWEHAAATKAPGSDSAAHERLLLDWYARPAQAETPALGSGSRHAHGITDLYGVTWEWTADYNAWSGGGVNQRGVKEEGLTCGGAPAGMVPETPYATYMRWAFRASLRPDFTVGTLGFRCAKDESGTGS